MSHFWVKTNTRSKHTVTTFFDLGIKKCKQILEVNYGKKISECDFDKTIHESYLNLLKVILYYSGFYISLGDNKQRNVIPGAFWFLYYLPGGGGNWAPPFLDIQNFLEITKNTQKILTKRRNTYFRWIFA